MRILAASAVVVALTGCVSQSAELRNNRGQVVQCANDGWGWLGATVAAARQSDCLKKAQAAGYKQQGLPQAASSPADAVPPLNPNNRVVSAAVAAPADTSIAIQAIPTPNASALPVPASQVSASGSPADRLKKLEDVYKSGLISKDEYDHKRQDILSTL